MTIRYVEFLQPREEAVFALSSVRIVGTDIIVEIEIVPEDTDYRQLLDKSDQLIGWLDVELVMALPRDIEGLKFDVVAIAKKPAAN